MIPAKVRRIAALTLRESKSRVRALFLRPSGTGESLAAHVVAAGLSLSMLRAELAGTVSNTWGETEKNFRAADSWG